MMMIKIITITIGKIKILITIRTIIIIKQKKILKE